MLTLPKSIRPVRRYRAWLVPLLVLVALLSGTLVVIRAHQVGATSPNDFLSTVKSQQSQLCLDAPESQTGLQQSYCDNSPSQLFSFQAVSGLTNTYTLVNQASNMCVDVRGASRHNSASVIQGSCNGNSSQEFQLRAVQDTYSGPPVVGTPVVPPVVGTPVVPPVVGTPVVPPVVGTPVVPPVVGTPVVPPSSGASSFQLVSVNSGKCLDAVNGYVSSGSAIDLWTCASDTPLVRDQLWQISGASQFNSAAPTTTTTETPPAMPGSTTPPAMPGSTTPPAMPGSTTPPAMPGSTTPPATSGSTTPTATSGSTTPPGKARVTPTATSGSTTTGSDASSIAQAVFAAINQSRAAAGLPAYTWSNALMNSAHQHNLAMAATNDLDHQVAGEADLGTRITQQGINWQEVRENIAYTGDMTQQGALDMENAMLSEQPPNDGHRQNILATDCTLAGVDVVLDTKNGKLWITEDFAKPF